MYHRFGLLPPGGIGVCSSLFPDSEGGHRSYGIKWLRAPAITEIAANAPAHRETMLATPVGTGRVLGNVSLET